MFRKVRFKKLEKNPRWSTLFDCSGDHFNIVLWGELEEFTFAYHPQEGVALPPTIRRVRGFLSWRWCKAEKPFYIKITRPCWVFGLFQKPRRVGGMWTETLAVIGEQRIPRDKDDVVALRTYGKVAKYVPAPEFLIRNGY